MRYNSFFEKACRSFRNRPRPPLSKLILIVTVTASIGGGLLASSHSKPHDASPEIKKKVVVLGTGWAATSFLKTLKHSSYDVEIISPRNYFAFTPFLTSVSCGTVEASSIVVPIRDLLKKKGVLHFSEAECVSIDPVNKVVNCRATHNGKAEFPVGYDYLVIAVGARSNTFDIPGVEENAYFLKEVDDALKIRRGIVDCFEKADLQTFCDEERKRILHFVIVGGGPTGVEFAAELHDFVDKDLGRLYPRVKDLVKITLVEPTNHILNMFDKRITAFAEEKFHRDGIDLKTGSMVVNVTDKEITTEAIKDGGEVTSFSYGMMVWSTGIGTRPLIRDFMNKVGQANRRTLAVDEWLRVEGTRDIYALGDCATVIQRKVMDDIAEIFEKADKDNSGTLTVKEVQEVISDVLERYPQIEIYLNRKQMKSIVDLMKDAKGNVKKESVGLNIEEFKKCLSKVDTQMKLLPASALVAAMQGVYLADCFNRMEKCEKKPEGPIRIRQDGRHRFKPFRYKQYIQFAQLGGEQAAAQLPGDWVSVGHITKWFWYLVYAWNQVSGRTRAVVVRDWLKRSMFGRDTSSL